VESDLFSDLICAPRAEVLCEAGHQRLTAFYDLGGLASNPDGHLMARYFIIMYQRTYTGSKNEQRREAI
jgi:hypothetical protein